MIGVCILNGIINTKKMRKCIWKNVLTTRDIFCDFRVINITSSSLLASEILAGLRSDAIFTFSIEF